MIWDTITDLEHDVLNATMIMGHHVRVIEQQVTRVAEALEQARKTMAASV